jgi:RNA polymerase primary sigma factor
MKSILLKGKSKRSLYTGDTITEKILSRYIKEALKWRQLTIEEEKAVTRRIRNGDKKAVEELIHANLLFVINVANGYSHQGVPLTDLISIGNTGLITAAKRFDERKNFRFISYAVYWIRHAILEALAKQSRAVRVPINKVTQIVKLRKAIEKIEKKQHRSATPEEIGVALKIKSPEKLSGIMSLDESCVSLNSPSDNGVPLIEYLEDENACSPDADILKTSEREEIERHLGCLTKIEKKVIREYYGLDDDNPKTLADIGKKYKVTRERARQLKERALKKLRKAFNLERSIR